MKNVNQNLFFWLKVASYRTIKPFIIKRLLNQLNIEAIYHALNDDATAIGITPAKFDQEKLASALAWLEAAPDHFVITLEDSAYPKLLKEIYDPPILLFAKGKVSALNKNIIAIVGSRDCSSYGSRIAFALGKFIAKEDMSIASGLALGVDAHAHRGALAVASGETIAVLGTGLNCIYPKSNTDLYYKIAEQGCLLSEFFPDTGARPYNFPKRNRIISGLSLATVVVEAAIKSGTLITAKCASEQNREVFAVPGSVFAKNSAGCHMLLQQGAALLQSPEDLLHELGIGKKPDAVIRSVSKQDLDDQATLILNTIGSDRLIFDVLQAKTSIAIPALEQKLIDLELQGLIKSELGCYFL